MMKKRIMLAAALTPALILAVIFLRSQNAAGAAKMALSATKVKTDPAGLDDPLWAQTPEIQVPLEGKARFGGKKKMVKIKAVYTYEELYLRFSWKDPTRSVTKESWQFDGQKWSHLAGNEDRLALLFEITRIRNFGSQGCTVTCHGPFRHPLSYYKLSTASLAEKGDLWHWKAARSDPYNHADDQWLTVAGEKSGRRNDAGKGGDIINETADQSRPLYMQDPARKPSKPGFLLMDEAVKITDYSVFKAADIIPYRLPKNLIGSRGDIKAMSRYADGGWTLILHRPLDTDHEDDVVFNPRKAYSFALAIFDDSGNEDSYDLETSITLKFKP